MALPVRSFSPHPRHLLYAAILTVPVIGYSGIAYGFDLPKLLIIAATSAALLILAVPRLESVWRPADRPTRAILVLTAALGGWVIVSTLRSDAMALSIMGIGGRFVGTVTLIGALVLVPAVPALLRDRPSLDRALDVLSVTIGIVAAYGVVQWLGLDPALWAPQFGQRPIGTYGNPNFVGAIMALGAPLAVRLWSRFPHDRRPAIALGLLVAGVLVVSESLLGVVAAAAGIAAYGIALAPTGRGRRTRGWLLALTPIGAPLAGMAIVLIGASAGYVTARSRLDLWLAVGPMVQDRPIAGVGVGRLLAYHPEYRGAQTVIESGQDTSTDSFHAVLLDVLTTLGSVGALLVVLVLVATGLLLRRTWLHGSAGERATTAALTGLFAAHGVQSSIAVPSVASTWLGWLLVGSTVAVATVSGSRPSQRATPTADASTRRGVAWTLLAVLAGTAAVLPLVPAVTSAYDLIRVPPPGSNIDTDAARERAERSVNRAPWWPEPWLTMGQLQPPALAEQAARGALAADPRSILARSRLAALAAADGRHADAHRWYSEALVLDPVGVRLRLQLLPWALETGRDDLATEALRVLERALEPDDPQWDAFERLRQRADAG